MSARTFWTSFLDGFTGEGILGDLRIPGTPTRLFKPDPEEEEDTLLVIRMEPGVKVRGDEVVRLRAAVERAVNETAGGRVVVSVPEAR
jgi:hypothetical protein